MYSRKTYLAISRSLLTNIAVCFLLMLAVPFSAQAEIAPGTTIKTCNDGGEWPPYLYYTRQNGEKTTNVEGYDLDYLDRVFSESGLSFTFDLIAWSRCLHEVETGETYKMVSSVAYSKERDEKYIMTDDYYTVQPHYFYAKANFPNGLNIESLDDFQNYKVCGLRGYNYTNFGIPVDTIDTGTKIFPQLIEKTKRARCDVFLGRFEIFAGFAKTGNDYIRNHRLGTASMPGVEGDRFYMMISRNYENAEGLKTLLNEGIARLKASGEAKRLLAPYLQ